MYCKKCGKDIPDDSVFCNHCGTRQTPKRIVVEFDKPFISEDSVRNGIFRIGRFLKPILIMLLSICIITGATYYITYYSFYYLHLPPEASSSEVELYREKGIITYESTITIQGVTKSYRSYRYEKPCTILPNCKWDLDEELFCPPYHTNCFDKDDTDINKSRTVFLVYKSEEFAGKHSVIVLSICLLYYLIRLFVKFRNWLYKK